MFRRPQLFLISAFTGFLFLVGMLGVLPLPPLGGKLRGVVEDPPAPDWSLANIRSGEAIRAANAWYDAHVGLRNFWVRLDSEFTYAFFGESIEHPVGTNVVAGDHDWLFERHYIKHALTPNRPEDNRVKEAIGHMRSVQDKLARRGIPFILLVAPNKAEIYPEHIPASQLGGRDFDQIITEYERYRPLLIAAGINLYDGRQVFLDWKKAGVRSLFARGGTHWSYDASVRILQDLRIRLNPGMRHPLPPFVVEKTLMESGSGTDVDLLNLLNLFTLFPYNHPQPRPVIVPQTAVPVEQLPRILWVHDSFGWPLIEALYDANAARPTESLYYFANFYRIPDGGRLDTDLKTVDWEACLKQHDAVAMVWTEIAFTSLGWGFFETLDAKLK
ncbi:MAG: hypothetical protein JWQ62_1730 [Lacunisphaera sp.]|nr:hypothetical protein [Lacunisphaera sp.]